MDKCLARTQQFHAAIDIPAAPPPGCSLLLIARDAHETPDVLTVDTRSGRVRVASTAPGDGTVTRASALMDERIGRGYIPRLRSPVAWSGVVFLPADHLGLTRDPAFSNYLLYTILEKPSRTSPIVEPPLHTSDSHAHR